MRCVPAEEAFQEVSTCTLLSSTYTSKPLIMSWLCFLLSKRLRAFQVAFLPSQSTNSSGLVPTLDFSTSLIPILGPSAKQRGRLREAEGRCMSTSAPRSKAQLLFILCCKKLSLNSTVLPVGNAYSQKFCLIKFLES